MRRIVEQYHQSSWQYRYERWGRAIGRLKGYLWAWKRYMGMVIGCCLLVSAMVGVGITFFSDVFHVREIRIRRADLRMNIERVEQVLNPFFGQHLFFVHASDIEDVLTKHMTDIGHIVLIKEYPNRLIVDVALKPMVVRLVMSTGEEALVGGHGTGGTIQDFLTSDGIYMRYRDRQVPDSGSLPVVNLVDWGIKPQPGQFLLEPMFLKKMFEAEELLRKKFGYTTNDRTVFLRAREFHLNVGEQVLWFDEQSALSEQIARYMLFLKKIGGDTSVQYIDLRLRDRVVYR